MVDPLAAISAAPTERLRETQARRETTPVPERATRAEAVEVRARQRQQIDARAVTRATDSDASAAPRPRSAPGDGDRELVSISDEARARLRSARQREPEAPGRSQAARRAAPTEIAAPEALETTEIDLSANRTDQLIAVRVGPVPIEDLVARQGASPEAALSERARLSSFELERVLTLPQPPEPAELLTLGSGEPSEAQAQATRNAEERERVRAREREAAESREERARERERALEEEPRDTRRADEIAAEQAALRQRQFEVARAEAEESDTTRFLNNLATEDPGPEPRPRQILGEASPTFS